MDRRDLTRRSALVGAAALLAGCSDDEEPTEDADDGGDFDFDSEGAESAAEREESDDDAEGIDRDRVHETWRSAAGVEFRIDGWVWSEDVRVADGSVVEPEADWLAQVVVIVLDDSERDRWPGEPQDFALVEPSTGQRFEPVEELPDGTPLEDIDDAGEHTLRTPSGTDGLTGDIFHRMTFDLPTLEEVVLDISEALRYDDDDADPPRYLQLEDWRNF